MFTLRNLFDASTFWIELRLAATLANTPPGLEAPAPGLAALPQEGSALAANAAPDLILLDTQLPGIDGFEVLRLFAHMKPHATCRWWL